MAVLKLLDDFYEHSYALIAIHSMLEDYLLAYQLNASLSIKLKRHSERDKEGKLINEGDYPIYHWYNEVEETTWELICNSILQQETILGIGTLFQSGGAISKKYLIPEMKKVDFFLKIDNGDTFNTKPLLNKLVKLQGIVTAYPLDPNLLKSKNNLIFLSNA